MVDYRKSVQDGYNTASGMSCCNNGNCGLHIHISRLQYRKRYELLQLAAKLMYDDMTGVLLQYRKRYELLQRKGWTISQEPFKAEVTIPQAV